MTHELNVFNEKEHVLELDSIFICKKLAPIVLNCIKNAIKVYKDDSENDILGMDESDLEICKDFISCFESICIKIENFINNNINESLNLKLNANEIEALQNAFEIYCIDMDKDEIDENHIKALNLYDKIKKINYEILNKANPKYIEMLNNFENTPLK